jgi:tetratricopeptide (TPR) repeat protein
MGNNSYYEPQMDQVDILLERATILKDVRKYSEAITILKEILGIEPTNEGAMQIVCVCMHHYENFSDGKIIAERMLAAHPNSDLAYFFHAEMSYMNENCEEAIEMINEAIRINPENPSYFAGKSKSYTTTGNPGMGIQFAEESRRLNPEYAFAYTALSHAHKALGNFDLAEQNMLKALSIKPRYYIFYHLMGEIYRLKKDKSKAIEIYKTSLSLRPDYAGSLNALNELESENNESGKWYKRLGKLLLRR